MFVRKTKFLPAFMLHSLEMTLFFVPLLTVGISAALLISYLQSFKLLYLFSSILSLYLIPLMTFRLVNVFFPLREGSVVMKIGEKGFTPWMGALHLQQLYNHFPALERLLKLFPPLYAGWLRAWGSKIGNNCFIQAQVDILDRTSVELGDRVFIGHGTVITAHLVNQHPKGFLLVHKKVKLGSNVFIAGGSIIGPGVEMEDGTRTHLAQKLIAREKITSGVNA